MLQGLLWQGLCCLLCLAHLPCCRQGFKPRQKCQHPAGRGGSRVEGRQGSTSHAVPPDSPEIPPGRREPLGSSIFQLLQWLQLMQSRGWWSGTAALLRFFLQLPPPLRAGWAGCCVCPAAGWARATWKHPAAQAVAVERAARQGKQPFIPVRLLATG